MKCVSCGSENQIKADYCKFCGEKFSEDTKKAAYGKTVYGRIDRFLEMKSWITLGKITGNPIVRILIILLLAVLVFVNIRANGSSLTIKDKSDYDLAYNPICMEGREGLRMRHWIRGMRNRCDGSFLLPSSDRGSPGLRYL